MLDKIKGCLFYKKNELKEIKESVVEMKESIKNIQESIVVEDSNKDENNDVDQEVQEKIKYCRYLVASIHTRKKVKSFKRSALFIMVSILIVSLALLFWFRYAESIDFYLFFKTENKFYIDVLVAIEIPLIVYVFTGVNSVVIRFKLYNEKIIKEFYKIALPLYAKGKISEQENIDLYKFYTMIQNPKGSDGIDEEKPALLNDKSNLEKIIDWFNLKLKGWKRK